MSTSIINQNNLYALSQKVIDRFDNILECLNIDNLKKKNKSYIGPCPVHNSSKYNSCNVYYEGVPHWCCYTNNCQATFTKSILGFIRGVLSHTKYNWSGPGDKIATFKETLDFVFKCLNENYDDIDIDLPALEKNKFIREVSLYNNNNQTTSIKITRQDIRKTLKIPSIYFISRDINADILDKYDVGLNTNPADPTYNRIVVPIYDEQHRFVIANTSRSIFDKCVICETWHNPKHQCPKKHELFQHSKWKHNAGFQKDHNLYNYWFAKEHIAKNKVVILVESPINVWKLEECGINTAVATYGASFGDGQKYLLNQTGAMEVLVIGDNDEAGQKYNKTVEDSCKNLYKVSKFIPKTNDIAEMSVEDVQGELLPLYLNSIKEWGAYV